MLCIRIAVFDAFSARRLHGYEIICKYTLSVKAGFPLGVKYHARDFSSIV